MRYLALIIVALFSVSCASSCAHVPQESPVTQVGAAQEAPAQELPDARE